MSFGTAKTGISTGVRCAFASARSAGLAHLDRCEDSICVSNSENWFIAAVADGAGSADHAAEGSALAVDIWNSEAPEFFGMDEPGTAFLKRFLARVPESAPVGAFATTFLGFVARGNEALFLQMGDGAAVVWDGEYRVILSPPRSEFINVTHFLTDSHAADNLRTHRLPCPMRLAMFSDGIEGLVLGVDNVPHKPFFDAVFGTLQQDEGPDSGSSAWLVQMLASEMVRDKTDDDTSIVIAKFSLGANA